MKKIVFALMCFVLLLAGCANHTRELGKKEPALEHKQMPPEDFIPQDVKIVSVGDSLTQGVGSDDKHGGYIPFLKENLENLKGINKAEFENHGKKGNRTDQLLSRLQQPEVQSDITDADFVIITIGGNDVMQVFRENLLGLKLNKFIAAEDEYQDRLDDILTLIRSYNSDAGIVLVGIYNPFIKWFSDIKEMDQIVDNWNNVSSETIAKYDHALFVPVADIFENNEESLLYTDYFHPNTRGYELIAERIYDLLTAEKYI
ncbi:SGNH/GDSL hydrolase family protein [Siminovitchia fortis]|uniref:SGNH/GDSL hydrolase family protein n=1 Tax=Siminovitchia fortis TaxID=254758 RepID=UPI0011A6211A|nr:SGNH/GDSL hydrolase family protein [Siminovitchia fortis]